MDEEGRQQAFLTAPSTTVSEANGRSALYLTSVSSALVALGFVAQVGSRFDALAAAVLPALFMLGEFTFIRLLELSARTCGSSAAWSGSGATTAAWSRRRPPSSATPPTTPARPG